MPKFNTLYCDPPWNEAGGGKIKRGADRHYPLMKTKDILALPVPAVMAENSHCYLWVTNNFLEDGLAVMKAWGYRYVTKITWEKTGNPGLGQYFRGMTEDCLFGVRGRVPYRVIDGKRQQSTTLLTCPRGEHSRKPEEMRERIERVSYGPMLEMFARPQEGLFEQSPLWTFIGHGAGGKDVATDLRMLAETK